MGNGVAVTDRRNRGPVGNPPTEVLGAWGHRDNRGGEREQSRSVGEKEEAGVDRGVSLRDTERRVKSGRLR